MHSFLITEYERAVIFRLGRLRKGGSKGPGIFTVIPCIDTYRCVDLRTVSFDVPPQEVSVWTVTILSSIGVRFVLIFWLQDSHMRLRHRQRRCSRIFQRHRRGTSPV